MSRVLTRIVQIQGIVVANIGRSYPLIRSQEGPGIATASRSTGREAGAIALPFGSHPKALSPQRLWNLLRLRQGTLKMGYSCQNPHGVPQGFCQANCLAWRLWYRQVSGLPWAEGWRSCQMRRRTTAAAFAAAKCSATGSPPRTLCAEPATPSQLLTICCAPHLASYFGKPSVRPCGA